MRYVFAVPSGDHEASEVIVAANDEAFQAAVERLINDGFSLSFIRSVNATEAKCLTIKELN